YAWPNWVLGNHDKSRIATRVGPAQARVAAMLLLTLRGTPTMYYGDEIGMHDVIIPVEEVQDPFEKNVPGLGLGRDPQRIPMEWRRTCRLYQGYFLAPDRGGLPNRQRFLGAKPTDFDSHSVPSVDGAAPRSAGIVNRRFCSVTGRR